MLFSQGRILCLGDVKQFTQELSLLIGGGKIRTRGSNALALIQSSQVDWLAVDVGGDISREVGT